MTNIVADMQLLHGAQELVETLQHQYLLALGGAALAVVVSLQIGLAVAILKGVRTLTLQGERLGRLNDGLALLTDTTEAGMHTVLQTLRRTATPPARARSTGRASVQKRVVAAARKGRPLARIAESEAISESEVRLHLSLAGQPVPGDQRPTAVAG